MKHTIHVHRREKEATGNKPVAEMSVHCQPISKMDVLSSGLV